MSKTAIAIYIALGLAVAGLIGAIGHVIFAEKVITGTVVSKSYDDPDMIPVTTCYAYDKNMQCINRSTSYVRDGEHFNLHLVNAKGDKGTVGVDKTTWERTATGSIYDPSLPR